jgi:NADPH:quinone reductase
MSEVVRLRRYGDAGELVVEKMELPAPGPGEVLVRQHAIGLNYVDIYHRTGSYPLPQLPAVIGVEGAGEIESVGPNVQGYAAGDRIAYAGPPIGSYASARILPVSRLLKLPASIAADTAAGAMLRGLTVHMLFDRVCPIAPGATVLLHAAAGGLGLLATQWAKRKGATVIGTVGSEAKAELAKSYGLDHAILYKREDFGAKVRDLTGGRGVDFAVDGIGGDTLVKTLDCVRPFGSIASVGQTSGSLPSIALSEFGPRRSLIFSRPSVFSLASDLDAYRKGGAAVFAMLQAGLKIEIGSRFPLADVAAAHRAMESGATVGSSLLIP